MGLYNHRQTAGATAAAHDERNSSTALPGALQLALALPTSSTTATIDWDTLQLAEILLTREDAAHLKAASTTKSYGVLHKAMRDELNLDSMRPGVMEYELDASLLPWKEYIASHPQSDAIIGQGITRASLQFIEGAKDPNRLVNCALTSCSKPLMVEIVGCILETNRRAMHERYLSRQWNGVAAIYILRRAKSLLVLTGGLRLRISRTGQQTAR